MDFDIKNTDGGIAFTATIMTEPGDTVFDFRRKAIEWAIGRCLPLDNAVIAHVCLEDVNFLGASMRGTKFGNVALAGASMQFADLSGATFDLVDLCEASFVGANLTGVSFYRTNLEDVDFTNATMDTIIADETSAKFLPGRTLATPANGIYIGLQRTD